MERLDATGYLAAPGFTGVVVRRLDRVLDVRDRLVLAAGPPQRAWFVRNVWRDPVRIPIESIGDAAAKLRAIQRGWALYATGHFRRASLIAERLPHVSAKPLVFPEPSPRAPLGSFTLLDRDTILASPRCSHPFPNGEIRFVEDRTGPPNRAYLKLQEALTLLGVRPRPGDVCLDAGASPGGWTWVLARLGARVLAVDRAPLDPAIANSASVRFEQRSAFSVQPATDGPFDWIVSDVVCYPGRLFEWLRRWVESGRCGSCVATIKLQGEDPYPEVERFEALGGRIVHLAHNKHELTFLRVDPRAPASSPDGAP